MMAIIPALDEGISFGGAVIKTKKYADQVIIVDNESSDITTEMARLGVMMSLVRNEESC